MTTSSLPLSPEHPAPLQEEHIPLKSRVWVSIADTAAAVLQSLVAFSAMSWYFTDVRGLEAGRAALVWLLFGIWNAINDPLFGYVGDRTKSSIGRRLPYIRYGAPVFTIGFILFWINVPGSEGNQNLLFIQMLLALFVYDILYTAIATSIYIMPYEMAISNKARSTIYIWKIIFMVFTIVIPLVFEGIRPEVNDPAGITIFRWIMVGVGVLMGILIFASTFFYQEKHFARQEQQPPFITAIVESFKNRPFLVFESISFTIIFAQTALMQGIWMYFNEFSVPLLPLYIALAAGIIGGVVLWIKQRDAWGVKTCTRVMTLIFALGCLSLLLGGDYLVPAAFGFLCFGFGFAGGMYLIPLMNGDVVDYDEHKTGLRREGMYAGINSLITKPAISIAQSALLAITAAYGYVQGLPAGSQDFDAQTGILIGWVAPTGVLLVLSFIILHWYPLAGEKWTQIKAHLADAHREKEKKYLEEHGYKFVE